MKKIFYIVLLAVVGMTMYSCSDDYETYAEQRDYELSHLSSFVNNPSLGEIKGKKINVISEEQFLANDTVTDVSKNEFVLFENGVYMQIVRRGCGSVLKYGESASILCRFKEYNLNGDSLFTTNCDPLSYQDAYDKIDVLNLSGTFKASFSKCDDNSSYYQGVMVNRYSQIYGAVIDVPGGWTIPLSYIKLGRPTSADEEIAKVRLIVPHSEGHAWAQNQVCAFYYEITYERGL